MAALDPRTGALGKRLAKHLLSRLTFGPTRAQIDALATMTASQAVDTLLIFNYSPLTEPIDHLTGSTWVWNKHDDDENSNALYQMVVGEFCNEAYFDNSAMSKLTFFLHRVFPTSRLTGGYNSEILYHQINLLRMFAKGDFKALAKKISVDSSMLIYLNGASNSKFGPNENYAREFLELFTIGKGPQIAPGDYTNYTDTDVAEAAKLFTGWRVTYDLLNDQDPATSLPRGVADTVRHDSTDKTFSPALGGMTITGQNTAAGMITEISDFVNMVFAQPETARNICRKIYQFFVHRDLTSDVETNIITPLGALLQTNNYDLSVVYKKLFKSKYFFDEDDAISGDEIIGGLVKSPLDYFLGTMRFFKTPAPDPTINRTNYNIFWSNRFYHYLAPGAGMEVFSPVTVASYPAYHQEPSFDKLWINSNTLAFRYKFSEMIRQNNLLIYNASLYGLQLDMLAFVDDPTNISNPSDPTVLVNELQSYIFPESSPSDRDNYFRDAVLLAGNALTYWTSEWNAYKAGGPDTVVRAQLESLFDKLIQSPEYQLA